MNEKILYYSKTITESLNLKIEYGEMETAQIIQKNIVVIYAKISEIILSLITFSYLHMNYCLLDPYIWKFKKSNI